VSVLELEHVSKRYRRGHREVIVLRDVSLSIESGEVVCVSGGRQSGRTALARGAAGDVAPDEGRVCFGGEDVRAAKGSLRRQLVLATTRFTSPLGRDVLEQVMTPLMAMRVPRNQSSLRAHRALVRVGVPEVEQALPETLVASELIRVVLARAIVREPRLVVLDEPTNGLDPLDRDPLLSLIQSLARETGMSFLLTAGETTSVTGADRVLRLAEGELLGRTEPRTADVVELRPAAEPSA